MRRVGVFCGSSMGESGKYLKDAKAFGGKLAEHRIGLVYGGSCFGVMGEVANAVLENGGVALGVIPDFLVELEVAHQGLTELAVTKSMHERKEKVYQMSDAFFALPGGLGTMDELCEILTWSKLDLHSKPIYVVNQHGFYDHLMRHFEHSRQEGFLAEEHFHLIIEKSSAQEALGHFLTTHPEVL